MTLWSPDFVYQFYPWYTFFKQQVLAGGVLPLWSPHTFSGTPFLANLQTGFFYPLSLLFMIIPVHRAFVVSIIVHLLIGFTGMVFLLRQRQMSLLCVLYGAIIFILNDFIIRHIHDGHLTLLAGYVWIPWVFVALNRIQSGKGILFAVIPALQLLGGYPQYCLYTLSLVYLYLCLHMLFDWHKRNTYFRQILKTIPLLMLTVLLTCGQLIPGIRLLSLSNRQEGLTPQQASSYSLPPAALITFLFPGYFERSHISGETLELYAKGIREYGCYCGWPALVFLMLAIMFSRRKEKYVWMIILAGALVFSLGRYTPLFTLVIRLPFLSMFRVPARALAVAMFAVSILSPMGIERCIPKFHKARRPLIAITGVVLLFSLCELGYRAVSTAKLADMKIFRIKSAMLDSIDRTTPSRVHSINMALFPNESFLHDLESINGYDPIILKRYIDLLETFSRQQFSRYQIDLSILHPSTRLLDMLDVRYVLKKEFDEHAQPVIGITERYNESRRIRFYRDAQYIPESRMLETMKNDGFDPLSSLYLDNRLAVTGKTVSDHDGESAECSWKLEKLHPCLTEAVINAPADGYALFSEIYYPGWKAFNNNRECPVWRGNYLFRAIPVNQSINRITMIYYPNDVIMGMYLFYAGICIAVFAVISRKRYAKAG